MATVTMMRASAPASLTSSSRRSARPSGAAARAQQLARIVMAAPRHHHGRHPAAVVPQASCQPCGPSAGGMLLRAMQQQQPRAMRYRRTPSSLLDLAFGPGMASSSMDLAEWLTASASGQHHAFNIQSFDDRYELTADTPGMEASDISVEISPEGLLRISGERKVSKAVRDADGNVSRQQRTAYSFSRSFGLPEDALQEGVAASLDKGVLTVSVPRKAPEPAPEPRRVAVKAAAAPAKPDSAPAKPEGEEDPWTQQEQA